MKQSRTHQSIGEEMNVRIRARFRKVEQQQRQKNLQDWRNQFIQKMALKQLEQKKKGNNNPFASKTLGRQMEIETYKKQIQQYSMPEEISRSNTFGLLNKIQQAPIYILNQFKVCELLQQQLKQYDYQLEQDREIFYKVYNILEKYIIDQNKYIQKEEYLGNILPLLLNPFFLPLFEIIAYIEDFDCKRLSLKYFYSLSQDKRIYVSENITMLISCCLNYVVKASENTYSFYFFIQIVARIFQNCEISSQQYVHLINILILIVTDKTAVDVLLSQQGIFKHISKIFPYLDTESQKLFTLRLISKVFDFADKKTTIIYKYLPQKQFIETIFTYIQATNKKTIIIQCLVTLNHIIHQNSMAITHIFEKDILSFLSHRFEQWDKQIQQQVVGLICQICTSTHSEQGIMNIFSYFESIMSMLCWIDNDESQTLMENLKIVQTLLKMLSHYSDLLTQNRVKIIRRYIDISGIQEKAQKYFHNQHEEVSRLSENILEFFDISL